MRKLIDIKYDFLTGKQQPKDDEYIGADGMVYCKVCNTSRIHIMPDNIYALRGKCDCQQRAIQVERERRRKEDLLENYYQRRRLANVPERYATCRLLEAQLNESNQRAWGIFKNYVRESCQMMKDNKGIFIYGSVGAGKTHMAASICNELLLEGWSVLFTTIPELISALHKAYVYQGHLDSTILHKIKRVDFLIIDDFGKEFMAREAEQGGRVKFDKVIERQILTLINARYNAKKPLIITSNYSKNELKSTLRIDESIVDRINEMATISVKITGNSIRRARQKILSEQMRGLEAEDV